MSEFIDDEAEDVDMHLNDENEDDMYERENDVNFTDDETGFVDQNPSDYRLKNVELSYEEALLVDRSEFECSDPKNFVTEERDFTPEFSEFKGW